MKITFTGKEEKLTASQERKLAMAFGRLSKLLDRRGEKAAQVALSAERHLQRAELRVNFYGMTLIGKGSGPDQFTAIMDSAEKVEKQALRNRSKFRETKRATPQREARTSGVPMIVPEPPVPVAKKRPKPVKRPPKPSNVIDAGARTNGKPMTAAEAMLAMEDDRDYMVYRDAESDKVSVLVRRRDGTVDLIEA